MVSLSVIVLAYNVEQFLPACLQSVANQAGADFEVITIDNASSDSCGAIIDRFATVDQRFVPVHLRYRLDMGEARNIGLAKAARDYVVFLDGDDTLAESCCLHSMARHIDLHHPDILMFDFLNKRNCGLPQLSNLCRALPMHIAAPFSLQELPAAIRVSWVSWNKAYRRGFIAESGLAFPEGYYEDAVWSCQCLLTASSIDVLKRVFVNRTLCRRDSISRKVSTRHAEIFRQYDRILDFMKCNPSLEFPGIRNEIIHIMCGFLRALSDTRKVIPDEIISEFRKQTDSFISYYQPSARESQEDIGQ